MLALFHISQTAVATVQGRPWPPQASGNGRPFQPPSTNLR